MLDRAEMSIVRLMELIRSRQAVVGVIGMGYVGLPLMLAATGQGFRVLGFDTNDGRVVSLNQGQSPLKHVKAELIGAVQAQKLFEATSDFSRLVEADCIVICVPTPLTDHREPDLSFVEASAQAISKVLRPGQLIVLEFDELPRNYG